MYPFPDDLNHSVVVHLQWKLKLKSPMPVLTDDMEKNSEMITGLAATSYFECILPDYITFVKTQFFDRFCAHNPNMLR